MDTIAEELVNWEYVHYQEKLVLLRNVLNCFQFGLENREHSLKAQLQSRKLMCPEKLFG